MIAFTREELKTLCAMVDIERAKLVELSDEMVALAISETRKSTGATLYSCKADAVHHHEALLLKLVAMLMESQ